MLTRFVNYCKLSYNELVHKTTWPTSKQLTSQAILVLVAALLIAAVVLVMDQVFQFIMNLVYPN